MNAQERIFHLLEEIARCCEVSFTLSQEGKEMASSAENLEGWLEFALCDERKMKLRMQAERINAWDVLRLSLTFERPNPGPSWIVHRESLEALLLCRIVPGTIFPIVPMLLPDDTLEWQVVLPLEMTIDASKKAILSIVEGAIFFYEKVIQLIRDLGFCKEMTICLRDAAYATGLVWTLGEWEYQKHHHAYASHSIETYSPEGHYYRLLPATEKVAGVITINLGNLTDFVGVENLLPHLLKANAITFLSDGYALGIDGRDGLMLMALLPPAEDYETKLLVTALLHRAVAVRKFFKVMTHELEAIRIQKICKQQSPLKKEGLLLL